MSLLPHAILLCACPAAAANTAACPPPRPCRLGQHTAAPWQRSVPACAPHAPAGGLLQQRCVRRFSRRTPTLPSGVPSPSPSSSIAAQGQGSQVAANRPLPPPGCGLAAASAATFGLHDRRWGYVRPASRSRAAGSAAAGTGFSGAATGPPPQEPGAAASAAVPSQPGDTPPVANGYLTSAASAASAGAATAAHTPGDAAAATSVDGEDETRKFVFAEEWGFSRVGGNLPEGTSPATFADMFPPRLFAFSPLRAAAAIAMPLAAIAAGYGWLWYMHSICPAWQAAAAAALIGTAYTGLFKVAHECARFAFLPQSPQLQDALGLLLMLPSLYPFTSWRLHHMHHLAHLNELWEDTFGWHPYTKVQLATELLVGATWSLRLRRLAAATPLKLLASVGHWLGSFDGLDLKRFHPDTHWAVLAGWAGPILFLGFGAPAIVAAWGWSGLLTGYLFPWLVFHFWLSTLSLLSHTAPHIPFRAEGEGYDAGRAAVCGTVTVRLPRPLELLLNDANYVLPQLLAPGLPVWHAREAYEYARERLLPYLTETNLSVKLLTNHITRWQVYDEEKHTYEPMDEVQRSIEADIDTILKAAEEQEAAKMAAAGAGAAVPAGGTAEAAGGGEEGGQAGNGAPGPAFA